jgi:hypothetical protein
MRGWKLQSSFSLVSDCDFGLDGSLSLDGSWSCYCCWVCGPFPAF